MGDFFNLIKGIPSSSLVQGVKQNMPSYSVVQNIKQTVPSSFSGVQIPGLFNTNKRTSKIKKSKYISKTTGVSDPKPKTQEKTPVQERIYYNQPVSRRVPLRTMMPSPLGVISSNWFPDDPGMPMISEQMNSIMPRSSTQHYVAPEKKDSSVQTDPIPMIPERGEKGEKGDRGKSGKNIFPQGYGGIGVPALPIPDIPFPNIPGIPFPNIPGIGLPGIGLNFGGGGGGANKKEYKKPVTHEIGLGSDSVYGRNPNQIETQTEPQKNGLYNQIETQTEPMQLPEINPQSEIQPQIPPDYAGYMVQQKNQFNNMLQQNQQNQQQQRSQQDQIFQQQQNQIQNQLQQNQIKFNDMSQQTQQQQQQYNGLLYQQQINPNQDYSKILHEMNKKMDESKLQFGQLYAQNDSLKSQYQAQQDNINIGGGTGSYQGMGQDYVKDKAQEFVEGKLESEAKMVGKEAIKKAQNIDVKGNVQNVLSGININPSVAKEEITKFVTQGVISGVGGLAGGTLTTALMAGGAIVGPLGIVFGLGTGLVLGYLAHKVNPHIKFALDKLKTGVKNPSMPIGRPAMEANKQKNIEVFNIINDKAMTSEEKDRAMEAYIMGTISKSERKQIFEKNKSEQEQAEKKRTNQKLEEMFKQSQNKIKKEDQFFNIQRQLQNIPNQPNFSGYEQNYNTWKLPENVQSVQYAPQEYFQQIKTEVPIENKKYTQTMIQPKGKTIKIPKGSKWGISKFNK